VRGEGSSLGWMRKPPAAIAACALVLGLTAAVAAAGEANPREVSALVSVVATPSTVTPATTTVTASGNVQAKRGCRRSRRIRLAYDVDVIQNQTPDTQLGTVTTNSDGNFTAVVPKPTQARADKTVTLFASVKRKIRKKSGRDIKCLDTRSGTTLTVVP
jgi:hypothetical protein